MSDEGEGAPNERDLALFGVVVAGGAVLSLLMVWLLTMWRPGR